MIDNPTLSSTPISDIGGLPAQPAINPGIKASGAPVSFSPKAQNTITSAFGNPIANSYDKAIGGPTPIPSPVIDSNVPVNNFYNT